MSWFKEKIDDVISKLGADTSQGLTTEEVNARIEKYGLNEFEEEKKISLFRKILHHLSEIPTLVLIAASIIALIAAIMRTADSYSTTQPSDWIKVGVILSIVVINVCLGLYQENKAEQALDALKKMNSFKTTVLRNGSKHIVDANQLVPGDIVILNTGDVITADGRILESSSLQVEEAALTGESVPVEKDCTLQITDDNAPLGDRKNMVYSGCLVTGGRAKVVVAETAMNTEMGKIAKLLNTTQKQLTPLQKRLKQLAKRISVVALGAAVIMLGVGLLYQFVIDSAPIDLTYPLAPGTNETLSMLLLAVALGVAAVPETLPIIVTMTLSYGVFNMVQKRALIRKIPAIETIGNTSVICSDKTGTLTQNKMKIQKLWYVGKDPISVNDDFDEDYTNLIEYMASCSNTVIEKEEGGEEKVIGDPTEAAIVRVVNGWTDAHELHSKYHRVFELPFDSGRKCMTTVHRTEHGYISITKGAFDRIPVVWSDNQLEEATAIHDSFAEKALRVLAVGYKKFDEMPSDLSIEALEKDLTFMGIVGMIDPPRSESTQAVARAKEAGIKTVMITGDHKATAIAIAKEIGIMNQGDKAMTGAELAVMSDDELKEQVQGISVYARVSPEDKLRIVEAWQFHNKVIAMTGDGVNDAPALKKADVGAAMGITGTEVSKSAADMVITDDNFATIVDAISEGRTSYDNIRKTIQFLLGVNFAEIFVLLVGMVLFGVPTLTAMQILIINVVYDGIPGFFLAYEKPEPGVMKRNPLPKGAGVFAQRVGFFIAARAVSFSILTMTAFTLGAFVLNNGVYNWDGNPAEAAWIGNFMAFMVLSWASTIDLFNTRTSLSIFKAGLLSNKGAFFTVIGAVIFALLIAIIPPVAQHAFNVRVDTLALSWYHWVTMVGLALAQVAVVELIKLALRIYDKKKAEIKQFTTPATA